jgi:uncharacterized membrane protein (DUF2068 family)
MSEHVRVLGIIGIVRAVFGLALGILLLMKATRLALPDYDADRGALQGYHADEHDEADLAFDRVAFCAVGGVCLAFAVMRLVQGIGALITARWARSRGLGLAVFDVINLALFPLSTALGLYGLVVYRHPETAERFRAKQATASIAG